MPKVAECPACNRWLLFADDLPPDEIVRCTGCQAEFELSTLVATARNVLPIVTSSAASPQPPLAPELVGESSTVGAGDELAVAAIGPTSDAESVAGDEPFTEADQVTEQMSEPIAEGLTPPPLPGRPPALPGQEVAESTSPDGVDEGAEALNPTFANGDEALALAGGPAEPEPVASDEEAPGEEAGFSLEMGEALTSAEGFRHRPRTPQMSATAFLVGYVLSAVVGLSLGYAILIFIQGRRGDFLGILEHLPPWLGGG